MGYKKTIMEDGELSLKKMLAEAEEAETAENSSKAIELYNNALKKDPLNEIAYDRLMKIFRRLKEYKKELAIINKGIKAYQQFYRAEGKSRSKIVNEISMKLNKSIGLIDKKGDSLYHPEPIARWLKRKITVEKKIS